MKTPRQLLFQRHRSAETKLDAIRARALAEMSHAKPQSREEKILVPLASWREILLSLRWHFTAMSAVWLLALFLSMDHSSTLSASATTVAKRNTPSPQQLVTALLENRRQIAELTSPSAKGAEPIPIPHSFIPPRRSEFSSLTEMA